MAHAQSKTDNESISNLESISSMNQDEHSKEKASDDVKVAEQKTVDEIESLCMNCHDNVREF